MERITGDAKVADVIRDRPSTIDVFLAYGCPDMRRGLFRMMSRVMSVRAAARVHRLPLEGLLRDLNAAAEAAAREAAAARSEIGAAS